ncbi:MAG TPA: hypothetical protein VG370_06690 [Chloroflexota bacterium]|nr:hypothetical protein [Chloroflexota bacterium]
MFKWLVLAAVGAAGYFAYRYWSERESGYAETAQEWVGEARDQVTDAAAYASDQAKRARDAMSA